MKQSDVLLDLKKQIKDNVAVNDDIVCDLCDKLIKMASIKDDTESVAFAYIWKADHFFYVDLDLKTLFEYLSMAKKYIDENNPSELLEKYYTLFRLYHHSFADHKTSLSYALKALEVAETLQDELRISANLGVIGELYLDHECYSQAFHYLNRSLNSLNCNNPHNFSTMRLILVSTFDCLVNLEKFKDAKQSLESLAKIDLEQTRLKIYVDRCSMIYYSYLEDVDKANAYAQELLKDGALEFANPTFSFDFISNLFCSMMRINNKLDANKALKMLREITRDNDYTNLLKISSFQIEFNTRYDHDKLPKSYKEYYIRYNDVESLSEQIKIEGLNAKLLLHETSLSQIKMNHKMKQMQDEANLDELTNVHNRRFLDSKQASILQDKTNKNVGFIIADIDYFKEYNDTYGHIQGDTILKKIAHILQTFSPTNMEVCRYGGDEFICICWNSNLDEMRLYIENVQSSLSKSNLKHRGSPCSDRVTLSIGYGIRDIPMTTHIFSFVEKVDQALYHAKEMGRNNAVALQYESEVIAHE